MAQTAKGAALTDSHRRTQVRTAITADSQARRTWDLLDLQNLDQSQPIWKRAVLDLLSRWYKISANQAAEYLPQFRKAETGDLAGFEVKVPKFDRKKIGETLDWFGSTNVKWHISQDLTQQTAFEAARRIFLGAFHEAVLAGSRDTIKATAKADTRAVGWRRVSDGHPCAFCAMLVSRGPAYTSEAKALSKQGSSDPYHPHCGCTVEIVYGDWQPTELEQQWVDGYYRAAESIPAETPRTAQDILPLMRSQGGFRDSPVSTGNPRGKSRLIYSIENGAVPDAIERKVGRQLNDLGYRVKSVAVSSRLGVKTPDYRINGVAWEMKTPTGIAKSNINNNLKKAVRQASNVILNLDSSPLSVKDIAEQVRQHLDRPETRLREVILLKGGRIVDRLKSRYPRSK